MVWISSMNMMVWPSSHHLPSRRLGALFEVAGYFAPASNKAMSSTSTRLLSVSGTSPATMRWAGQLHNRGLPTPGLTNQHRLFFVRRLRIGWRDGFLRHGQ